MRPAVKNKYEIRGNVTAIYLERRDGSIMETMIDTADLPKVLSFEGRWHATYYAKFGKYYVNGNTKKINGKSGNVVLHRWLMDAKEGYQVDHINHDTLDNRRSCNLREATRSENAENRNGARSDSRSGIRGVRWINKTNKWEAMVRRKGKTLFQKHFSTKEEAENAAKEARAALMPYSQEALSS